MIAVDTSALMSIVFDEPSSNVCIVALAAESKILMSAGTFAETLIVSSRQGVGDDMATLIDGLNLEIVAVT